MIGSHPLTVTVLQLTSLLSPKNQTRLLNSRSCYIDNNKYSAFLQTTKDKPQFSVKWGNKILVKEANKPFSVEHPLLNKHTFKITNVRPKPKPISIFEWLKNEGNILQQDMYRIFNCGIGLVLIANEEDVDSISKEIKSNNFNSFVIGKVIEKNQKESVIFK